jgi:hypothetical protein
VPVPALGPSRPVVPVRIAGRGGRRTARKLWLMRNIWYPVGVLFLRIGRMFRVDSRLSRTCERMRCRGVPGRRDARPGASSPRMACRAGAVGGCPAVAGRDQLRDSLDGGIAIHGPPSWAGPGVIPCVTGELLAWRSRGCSGAGTRSPCMADQQAPREHRQCRPAGNFQNRFPGGGGRKGAGAVRGRGVTRLGSLGRRGRLRSTV